MPTKTKPLPVVRVTLEDAVKQFGPFHSVSREQAWVLNNEEKGDRLLAIVGSDIPWNELPENDRPDEQELAENFDGETPETYSEFRMTGIPGYHFVNLEYHFVTAKPVPDNLEVEVNSHEYLENLLGE